MNTPLLIVLAGGAFLLMQQPAQRQTGGPTTAPPSNPTPNPGGDQPLTERQQAGLIQQGVVEVVGGVFSVVEAFL